MNQIIYNSFPRSGNVYSSSVSPYFFTSNLTAVHIPEIFGVKELDQITIFRKPEDAISSLINKQSKPNVKIEQYAVEREASRASDLYRKYMSYAKINKDLIYIGKFEDLTTNTVKHFENIAKRFNRELNPDYELNFKNAEFLGKVWDDRYDGHIPRPKDEIRLDIEDKVKELSFVQELNKEYEEFINNFATKVSF
jgi:hypothetical protein